MNFLYSLASGFFLFFAFLYFILFNIKVINVMFYNIILIKNYFDNVNKLLWKSF